MKNTKLMTVGTLVLFCAGIAAAQSLGDYARAVRKNKPDTTSESRHFDNDNLPTGDGLSVVGPPAEGDAKSASAPAPDPAPAATDRQKKADDLKAKMDEQKAKIAALNHELDLDQRELRLRSTEIYSDPGKRMQNPTQWDEESAKLKTDAETKQKAMDAAKQELDQIQEQAHKAGLPEPDDTDKNKKDQDKDNK
ncbi:MAG: hypothetical protein WAK29_13055 [Terriglobales bacterium]